MSKLGTANTVVYVKRPSSSGAKDVRPATSGQKSNWKPSKVEKKGQ